MKIFFITVLLIWLIKKYEKQRKMKEIIEYLEKTKKIIELTNQKKEITETENENLKEQILVLVQESRKIEKKTKYDLGFIREMLKDRYKNLS